MVNEGPGVFAPPTSSVYPTVFGPMNAYPIGLPREPLVVQPSQNVEHWKMQANEVKNDVYLAEAEVERARLAHTQALDDARYQEKTMIAEEQYVMDGIFDDQNYLERRQEYRAEELAEDAADQALVNAQEVGYSYQQSRLIQARTYQDARCMAHMQMCEMAKASALHSHHDHAQRQQRYRESQYDINLAVQQTLADLQQAQRRMQIAQASREILMQQKNQLKGAVARGEIRDAPADGECSIM